MMAKFMGYARTPRIVIRALASILLGACGSVDGGTRALPTPQRNPIEGRAFNDGGIVDGGATPDAWTQNTLMADGGRSDSGAGDGSTALDGPIGDKTGTAAIRSGDFLNSIGVCTHVGQGVDGPTESAVALSYAGIRNVRDDAKPAAVPGWISMHQSAGIRVCVVSNQNVSSSLGIAEQLNAAGALLAVEGPNEPNNFPVTYENKTSSSTTFLPVAHFQRDLYAAVKSDAKLSGIPVFHSSEAGGSEPDNVGLQFLTIPNGAGIAMPDGTRYADYANTHNYVCGHSGKMVDNVAWNASDPTLNGDWDGLYVEYGHTWHSGFNGYPNPELVSLPKVTTETGWVTSGSGAIPEEQQGRIFLNLYLSAFKRGFAYTFIYMLRDDPVQGYWGLFDASYKPKKSGAYLHNLTTILADTGTGTPGLLSYSIANAPATVHDLLLQKSDGMFDLVVWDERPSGGSDVVALTFGTRRPSASLYDPTTGTAPTQIIHDVSSLALSLSDHPMVIEL